MTPPRGSALIVTYNRAGDVAQAIRSALDQDVQPEVIVVDDESTDNTSEIVQQFPSVRYIRQPNRKEGAARNNGAAQAAGEYLAFLDADDYWLRGKLAADIARFERADGP